MTFPLAQRDVAVEMLLLGGWTDVTNDVRLSDGIKIKRGRDTETADVSAPTCNLTLDNRTGKYSTRNPTSPYYPSLGRNTPLRVAIRVAKDSFTRSVSGGWGTGDVGGAWTTVGVGGTVQASDWNVTGTAGTLNLPVANCYRAAYQAGQLYRDVDVAATVSVPFSAVTGGDIDFCVLGMSGLSTTDYLKVVVKVSTAQVVTIALTHPDGTVFVADTVVPGLTFSGQALRVRGQVDGQTIRGKVWAASSAEPYAWNVEAHTDRLVNRAPGWFIVRSGNYAGNTNVPYLASVDNVEVRSNRFAGEIAAFPPEWDPSGKNVYTKIQAGGLLRRITQGASPLKSTYRRGNETISPAHIAYWPVEEGTEATSIASGIGGSPMSLVLGTTTFATDSSFPGSAPIAKSAQSRWVGPVPKNTATGQIQLLFLLSIPSGGEVDQATLAQIQTSGTAAFIDVFYQAAGGGGLKIAFYNSARTAIHTSGTIPFALNGRPVQLSVELTQSGGDVNYLLATLDPGQTTGATGSGTATGCTIGSVNGLFMNAYRQATSSAYGHVAIRNQITSIFTLGAQLNAYNGETASTRSTRLCTENSLPSSYVWDGAISAAALGFQGRAALPDLLKEAAKADFGSLYDSRNHLSFQYRARSSLYNQSPVLALDYTAPGHIPPPFKPVEDDQALRNDFTATRKDGSSFQAIQTTGRLAVTDPTTGTGVGRYDDGDTFSLYADDQVQSTAGWALSLGTVDEARYPTITVKLAALANVSPTLALAALMVNLDDKITIANPKMEIAPGTISQLARGYTETINAFTHDMVFNCAPASPYEVVVLDDTARGRIDSETTTLAAPVSSTATKLLVVDSSTCGWTSDAPEMPIPITVGGEDMSITAVSTLGPTFVAAGVASEGSNAPRTPALPAGWAEGDALLVLAAIRNSPDGQPVAPAGYTLLGYANNLCLFGKIATASESAPTVTFTGGITNATCHAQMAAFRGCSINLAGNPVAQLNASAQNIAYPAFNVVSQRSVIIYIGWKQDDWTSVATIAGATEIGEVSTTTGDDAGIVWDYAIQPFATPANIAAGSFVVTGGASAISRGMVVALDGNAQLLTVTRSVNGVIKPQSYGTSVGLTRRAAIAL